MTGKTWLLNLADAITSILIHMYYGAHIEELPSVSKTIISIDQGEGLAMGP